MRPSNIVPFLRAVLYSLFYPGIRAKYIHSNVFILNPRKLIIAKGSTIFQNVTINNYHQATFGKNCLIGPFVSIRSTNGALSVSHNFSINPFSLIDCNGNIIIGRDVRVGAHSYIGPAHHDYRLFFKEEMISSFEQTPIALLDITIGDNVWIGTNVQIHPGSNVESNCIIGQSTSIRQQVKDATLIYNKFVRDTVSQGLA